LSAELNIQSLLNALAEVEKLKARNAELEALVKQ
jgi:hypothetical protein